MRLHGLFCCHTGGYYASRNETAGGIHPYENNPRINDKRPLYLAHVRQRTGDLFPAALCQPVAVRAAQT